MGTAYGPAFPKGILVPLFCRPCFSQEGLGLLSPAGISSTPGAGVPLMSPCRCPGKMSRGWLGTLVWGGSKDSEKGRSSSRAHC